MRESTPKPAYILVARRILSDPRMVWCIDLYPMLFHEYIDCPDAEYDNGNKNDDESKWVGGKRECNVHAIKTGDNHRNGEHDGKSGKEFDDAV